MVENGISLSEYAKRRKYVLRALKGSVGLVMAGDGAPPLRGEWFPDMDFAYLTGIMNEPGAMVFFDPSNPDPKKQIALILRPVNPELDVWDGYRDLISEKLRKETGFDTVLRTLHLPRMMTEAAKRTRRLCCLHSLSSYTQPVSADYAVFQKVAARIPGCVIEDQSDLLTSMRMIKSPAEIKQIRSAIKATATGIDRVFKAVKPGINERELHNILIGGFQDSGSMRNAFDPIVGSGHRATVLHYKENNQTAEDGDLLVLDCGAEINRYASDITRTFPVNGKFTAEQKKLYNIVLKSQMDAIKAIKPGVTLAKIDAVARKVITDAGYGDYFLHSIGHHMGLETHDSGSATMKLKPGMVITIEPGIYIAEKSIGIRIEDDILVTETGSRNLSAAIPKTINEIEAALKG
ncbi:MAG: aminopeptidase P family protein [Phycisphaerales bacterium]|nr:aminopeptidase P family protein [Phycisphaerales bacterium]